MSFKSKLSVSITILIAVILTLNSSLSYMSTRQQLKRQVELQMMAIAKQVSVSVEGSQQSKELLEDTLGEKLRIAAIAAQEFLDPDINKVTTEQLIEVSAKIGVDGISLWQRSGEDIVVNRSSNEKELGLGSITFDYWHTAFQQLLDLKPVTVPQGQKLEHYWSGPINFAASDPREINKWGYYYDGTTNYMINTIVNSKQFLQFNEYIGTNAVIKKMIEAQPNILEITGIDPEFFGKSPIIEWKQGIPIYNMDVRAVSFGSYNFKDEMNDTAFAQKAIELGEMQSFESRIDGHQVIKSFIPIKTAKPYVIAIAFDQQTIQDSLNDELLYNIIIAAFLLLGTMACSYKIADIMISSLKDIVNKVNTIADGDFNTTIPVRTKDELGLLASSVNAMSNKLRVNMKKLNESAKELRSTKEYLESFVNQTSDAIHVTNLHGKVTSANRAFETMFGWSYGEIVGERLNNIAEEHAAEYALQEAIVRQGGSVADYEMVRYTRTGEAIDLSVTISPIRDENGNVIAIASISRNITSRKNTEELIRRTEKLSVVGQLAAGVAHEVRNPLTTLRGFVQLNKKNGTISPAHLDIMLRELDQINMIVSELLVFAKPQASRIMPVQLEDVMKDTIILLDSEAKQRHISLELQAKIYMPSVNGEASQLKQVFVNVLKNSIEAMENGGCIKIQLTDGPNHTVSIRVIDEGCGISEEDLKKLGEPFFTRKEDGTGLGLMVSQTIIANHKGTIRYQSQLGKGTCVEITLPQSSV